MRVVLVDDERAARGAMKRRLHAFPEFTVIAEASDGFEAIAVINSQQPELVFLDVQMPLLSGFEVLPYLKHKPMIVFCSAHDQYAVQAFEEHALDYLLKPVDAERLAKCLARVQRERNHRALIRLAARHLEKVVCHAGGDNRAIWISEVRNFRKVGRYAELTTDEGKSYLTDLTMDYLQTNLDDRFFRVNRSLILRKDCIDGYRMKRSGSATLTTDDGETVPLSKSRIKLFRVWFHEHTISD